MKPHPFKVWLKAYTGRKKSKQKRKHKMASMLWCFVRTEQHMVANVVVIPMMWILALILFLELLILWNLCIIFFMLYDLLLSLVHNKNTLYHSYRYYLMALIYGFFSLLKNILLGLGLGCRM